jgi:hypothetical protein
MRPSFENREVDAMRRKPRKSPSICTIPVGKHGPQSPGKGTYSPVTFLLRAGLRTLSGIRTEVRLRYKNETRINHRDNCRLLESFPTTQYAPLVKRMLTTSVTVCINALEPAGSQSADRELKPHRSRPSSCFCSKLVRTV